MAAKIKDEPVTKEHIERYLDTYSDFTFEIKTLNLLTHLGFKCRHSGTYTDPITHRMREFDIRAMGSKPLLSDLYYHLFAAVECKNLKESFPLIVHCMPRAREEAFEEMIVSYEDKLETQVLQRIAGELGPGNYAAVVRQHRTLSLYEKGQPVGKSTDQIGQSANKQEDKMVVSDGDVFEKISQALNSSKDLIEDASRCQGMAPFNVSSIKPILVVPDNTLWRVDYDENGNVVGGPEKVAFVPYFYGKTWPFIDRDGKREYTISHLDIVTIGRLQDHINEVMGFETEDLVDHLRHLQEAREITDKVNLCGR